LVDASTQAGVIAARGSSLSLPFQITIGGAVGAAIAQSIELIADGVSNGQDLYTVIGE
jgi:hypothetical protein